MMTKPRVLLVEDELVIRQAFEIILTNQDYDIDIAANGEEAAKLCESYHYDLILLDLMMPVLDGVGFLEKVNPAKNLQDTRVVILSNLSSGEAINQAIELGAHRSEIKANLGPAELIKLVSDELANRAS